MQTIQTGNIKEDEMASTPCIKNSVKHKDVEMNRCQQFSQLSVRENRKVSTKRQEFSPTTDIRLVKESTPVKQEATKVPDKCQELEPVTTEHVQSLHTDYDEFREALITIEQESVQAPDGGWGWFVVLGSSIVHALIGLIILFILSFSVLSCCICKKLCHF
jgi:hypothetical protein